MLCSGRNAPRRHGTARYGGRRPVWPLSTGTFLSQDAVLRTEPTSPVCLGHSEPSRRRALGRGRREGRGRAVPSPGLDAATCRNPPRAATSSRCRSHEFRAHARGTAATRECGPSPRVGGPCSGGREACAGSLAAGLLGCSPLSPGRRADVSGMRGTCEGGRSNCPDHG